MAIVIGRNGIVGVGVEATRGTSVAPSHIAPVTSFDFDDAVEYADNDAAFGRIEEKNDADIIKRWAEGEMEGKIYLNQVGVELTALFGAAPTSVQRSSSGVYDHSYAVANTNQHKALTLAYEDSNYDLRYTFAMIDTWSLEAVVDNYVKRTVGFKSKKGASASNSMSVTDEREFLGKDIVVKLASALAGLDAASAIDLVSIKLEFAKNAEPRFILGSIEPTAIDNKQFAVTGSFDAYISGATYKDLVMNGTQRALRLDMIDSGVDLGSSHNPQLRFDLAKCKFGGRDRGWDANDFQMETIEFEGMFSIADTSLVTARLTNTDDGDPSYTG